ncbi:hypothetical protein CLV90_2711 [Maribacter spongiicola]|uniref:Uncharacterized protein n=1 Tax=Maribacter spongiicola TaxID=1206753 RepID=A0A4R7K407_9FLAO|nr:hypothetical protein [Maribacter spongiicola]TDT45621.1 hypothetical protein CLV90_2711 [Maribacter spongiicola]
MEKGQQNAVKGIILLGIVSMIAGIALLYWGKTLIGISGTTVGAGLALTNYKKINKLKDE